MSLKSGASVVRQTAIRLASVSGVRHVLPDFLVLGIKKGGTSSLESYLRQHPLVRCSRRKEPRFFHSYWRRGAWWYRTFFPLRSELAAETERLGCRPLVFEATPDNLYWPDVPPRAARVLPGRHFIALLRNPLDRAWSDYRAHVRAGREDRSFEAVVDAELAVLHDPSWDPVGFSHDQGKSAHLLSLGLYADQLVRWYRYVPRDHLLVVRSEDLFAEPGPTMRGITDFLALPPHHDYSFTPSNVGGYKDRMDPAVRDRLLTFYEPHNRRLYRLLDRDLGWD